MKARRSFTALVIGQELHFSWALPRSFAEILLLLLQSCLGTLASPSCFYGFPALSTKEFFLCSLFPSFPLSLRFYFLFLHNFIGFEIKTYKKKKKEGGKEGRC